MGRFRHVAVLVGLAAVLALGASLGVGLTSAVPPAAAEHHPCHVPGQVDDSTCCVRMGLRPGCTPAPPPTPPTELRVRVTNSRAQLVRGILVEVKRAGRRVAGGTTAGPDPELRFNLSRGSYTVIGRTPPGQRPLNLSDSENASVATGRITRVTLRINAGCGEGSRLAATSFSHGGTKDYSSSRNDVIRGTPSADRITDPNGNDVVCGNGGADTIRMFGTGRAQVFAGAGNDIVRLVRLGASRPHQVFGGAGRDDIEGSRIADELNGGAANDRIRGDNGRDVLRGEAGNDTLEGGYDVDRLFGGDDNDIVQPGPHAEGSNFRLDPNARQLADCGKGRDDLRQHDIYSPYVTDVRDPQQRQRPAYAFLRSNGNYIPLRSGCEKLTFIPPA